MWWGRWGGEGGASSGPKGLWSGRWALGRKMGEMSLAGHFQACLL